MAGRRRVTITRDDDTTATVSAADVAAFIAGEPEPTSQTQRVASALATIENDASLADNVKQAIANVVTALSS
jgi:hypothetical protein